MAKSESALEGLRVVEVADAQGAYCGKLLADMGADVVKIEPPGGAAQRREQPFWHGRPGQPCSLPFLYHNTSKKSLLLDLQDESGQATVHRLLRYADILIVTGSAESLAAQGLDYTSLHQRYPGLIVCAISGFGQFGPHSHFASSDLVASAMSGAMAVIGFADDAPVKLAGNQAYVTASNLAAIGALIALYYRRHSGSGQLIDVSLQEAMLSVSSICGVGKWLEDGIVPHRFGTGLFAAVPSGVYPCTDGSIYLIVNRPRHWQVLARWIAEETDYAEALDAMFEGPSSARQPYRELLDLYISELTAKYSVDAFYREGQRRHLAVTPLHTATRLVADPHLQARQFFVDVEHPRQGTLSYPGPPCRLSLTPWRIASPAPLPGQHNAQLDAVLDRWREAGCADAVPAAGTNRTALSGLRVVEFSAGMAGPWIGRYLAWCGADVIKVESRDFPDVTRLYVPPQQPELGIQPQLSPWFTDWNAGKRFVALDLCQPEGAALARELVAHSDIVIDNNANGVLDKLGLGFDRLRALKADLILFSSTGYGNTGPDAGYISWGPNIETLSGLSALSGFAHRPCTMTQFAYPDPLSALSGLFAILCALEYRCRSGHGQTINLSQQEATIAALGEVMMEALANQREPLARGNQSSASVFEGCYPCAGDERWLVLTLTDEQQWRSLVAVLGDETYLAQQTLADGLMQQQRAQIDKAIAACTRRCDARHLMQQLQRHGIAAALVQNTEDQYHRDPHLKARHFFERIAHRVKGEVVAPGIPLLFSETPGKTRDTGRAIGEDNQAVLGELLGLDEQRIAAYVEAGIIQ